MISEVPWVGLISLSGLWVVGGAALCLVGRACADSNKSLMLVHFATGGYLAHVAAAFAIFQSRYDTTPHAAFGNISILFVFAILASSLLLAKNANGYCRKGEAKSSINIYAVIVLTALVITVSGGLNMSFSHPISGWDTLQLYAQKATQFLQSGSMLSEHHWENRHPPTIPLILAMPYFEDSSAGNYRNLASITWWSLWIANALLVFGCCTSFGLRAARSSLLSIVAVTIPIVENHALLPGYTELFAGIALLATTIYWLEWIRTGCIFCLIVGVIISVSALFIKNTSPFYVALPLLSLVAAKLIKEKSVGFGSFLFLVFLSVAVIFVLRYGFVFHFLGNSIGVDGGYLFLGGRELKLAGTSADIIIQNIQHAYFLNQTFSISSLIFIVALIWAVSNLKYVDISFLFVVTTVSLGLCGLIVSQLTDYGLRFAMPNSDTGNSRFSTPVMMLVPLLLVLLVKNCEDCAGLAKRGIRKDV